MKELKRFSSLQEAEQAASFLRSHGILTHISSATVNALGTIVSGGHGVRLWVVLDNQYEDAQKVLTNEVHTVTSGLSSAEMEEFKANASSSLFRTMNKAIVVGLLLVAVMVYLVFEVAR